MKPVNAMREKATSRRQRGTALVVSLIFLVLMTLLGTSSMKTVTMQEKMSGSMRDWQLGFQSAEAAVRAGEDFLYNTVSLPEFNDANGYYQKNSDNRPDWAADLPSDGNGYIAYPNEIAGVAQQPRYFIEILSTARPAGTSTETGTELEHNYLFRITAVGYGGALGEDGAPRSAVVLSSVYRSR